MTRKTVNQSINLTEYNSRWPLIYNREKNKILKALGQHVRMIEHIGSTSIIGLAAKPVIDIMVTIKSFSLTNKLIEPLRRIGYQYVPEYEADLPDRRFFHRGPSEITGAKNRHFHLHIVEQHSGFWKKHIRFRDYLRSHPLLAQEYEALKKKLARSSHGDINKYSKGKTDFIKRVLRLASKNTLKLTAVKIRRFKDQDAKQTAHLINKIFDEQVSLTFSKKGRGFFHQSHTTKKILALALTADVYVAEYNKKIIGIVGKKDDHIIRLFVDPRFQGKGIAKKLMKKMENLYKKRGTKKIRLCASLYALNFYKAMGYKKSTRVIHHKTGMVYQPMIKRLSL